MNRTQKAFKELMEKYNEYLAKWIEVFKIDKGFNEWFTQQIQRSDKT